MIHDTTIITKYWWSMDKLLVEFILQPDGKFWEFHNGERDGNKHSYTKLELEKLMNATKILNWQSA